MDCNEFAGRMCKAQIQMALNKIIKLMITQWKWINDCQIKALCDF